MFWSVFPFLLAILCFMMMKPLLDYMISVMHMTREMGRILLMLLFYIVVGCIVGILLFFVIVLCMHLFRNLPYYYKQFILPSINDISKFLQSTHFVVGQTNVFQYLQQNSTQWLAFIMDDISIIFRSFPRIVFAFSLFLLSSFFLFLEYDLIKDKILMILKPHHLKILIEMKNKSINSIKMYMKCQIILMSVCFILLYCGFRILSFSHSFFLALCICVLDTLPFVGIGVGLFPIIVISFVHQNYFQVIYLIILYLFITMTRSLLEPHIMNKQMKIPSFLLLFSMVIHIYFFGVIGVILSPIHMNVLYSLLKEYKI